jgi:hypothetical protein
MKTSLLRFNAPLYLALIGLLSFALTAPTQAAEPDQTNPVIEAGSITVHAGNPA